MEYNFRRTEKSDRIIGCTSAAMGVALEFAAVKAPECVTARGTDVGEYGADYRQANLTAMSMTA